jgi:flagellar biosynthesis GTPase FlhF
MQHPLHPDYVAITHLDEAKKWGPLIPFFADMGCGARYISSGRTIPDSLSKFEPASFAQQVLQNR